MGEHRLTTLIDQYLLGTISEEDRSQLELLILSDPSVSTLVRESEAAFKVLQHEKKRRLKEKLRGLDQDELRRQGFQYKPVGMLSVVVIVCLAGLYLLAGHYSLESIALRNFEPYPTNNATANTPLEDEVTWTKAKKAFMEKDFETAIHCYITLSEQAEKNENYTASWNILLAQFAIGGPTPNWKMSLESFINTAPEPLRSKAVKLSALPDSFLYRLFHNKLHEKFSTLKPRLI